MALAGSSREDTYSKLPPGYRTGCTGDLINTGGRSYKVWDSGHDNKRPDIHDVPLSAVTATRRMPEHGDFPRVIVDMEPFRKWPENRRPKEVVWIIPAREDPPKQTGSTGSPAHCDSLDSSDRDSRRDSPASSWASSPTRSVGSRNGSAADDLLLSSSRSGSGSETPSLSGGASDDDGGRASGNESAGPSGGEEGRSDHENNPGASPGHQPANRRGASGRESESNSSDSDDECSDDGMSTTEAAQHLEAVYSQILDGLHKTAKIMSTGYMKAAGEIQPIVHAAVQEAVRPNKAYIQSTTGHLSEWGEALHAMLNSDGANAEERDRASRAARLAGLKCVRSLLADGQAFNEAEEHDMEKRLHDTV